MKAARLRLRPPGGAFPGIDRALAGDPAIEREQLLNMEWLSDGSYALLYQLAAEDAEAIRSVVTEHADVIEYDIVDGGDTGRHYLFVHVDEREPFSELLAIAERHALFLSRPFQFTEDGVIITAVGSSDALQDSFADVTDQIPVTVEWTGSYVPDPDLLLERLTDRQREALQTAYDQGFYEKPRRASYDDIAAALDCAPTTANELLRRAEATLVEAILEH